MTEKRTDIGRYSHTDDEVARREAAKLMARVRKETKASAAPESGKKGGSRKDAPDAAGKKTGLSEALKRSWEEQHAEEQKPEAG